jgi:hypothetical protein
MQGLNLVSPSRILTATALLLILQARIEAIAADGPIQVEELEYRGWGHNLKITNGDVELIATLDVGPRIISYKFKGGRNVFKEYDEQMGHSGEAEWMIRGGHRLWTAPEDTTRTYALDNAPVAYRKLDPGIRLIGRDDQTYSIRKEIDIRLAAGGSHVQLTHRITNIGPKAVELAPWALSVMAPGGTEIIPLPPKKPHPESLKSATGPSDFGPNQFWVLWPYTDLSDPRWRFDARSITLTQRSATEPTKLGLRFTSGKVGYANGNVLFVKSFIDSPGRIYPDGGVNYETYSNGEMLEMESLGPLERLETGRSVVHGETWELHAIEGAPSPADLLPRLRSER